MLEVQVLVDVEGGARTHFAEVPGFHVSTSLAVQHFECSEAIVDHVHAQMYRSSV